MVQPYGSTSTTGHTNADPAQDANTGEDSALLGADATQPHESLRDGTATMVSCVSNLSNTIIGSGMYTVHMILMVIG
jgi:hypothetical protein